MAVRDAKVNAMQLFGLVMSDGGHPDGVAPGSEGVTFVAFRDVIALVSEAPYVRLKPSDDRVRQYRRVVEGTFTQRTVLPAPFGTVFRSHGELLRWLELHYFTLVDAIAYLDDRLMARVRITPASLPSIAETVEVSAKVSDLETAASDSFRLLRRHAIASIAAPPPSADSPTVQASFLVERERWTAFGEAVREETRRFPDLRIDQSGPFPPYDFVRMEFGG
jgi:hypothetical protein